MDKIKIEVSARHCHLCGEDLAILFGEGYEFTKYKDLSQPGQFAAEEKITIKTDGGQLEGLRILGPVRDKTQVELSMTDARKLKINAPLRLSGDLAGSASAVIAGPQGEVKLKEGVIIAKRHIHCDPKSAAKLGLSDEQDISVKTTGERSVIFHNVSVRISDKYSLVMHIDTDEGNASSPDGICSKGEIIK